MFLNFSRYFLIILLNSGLHSFSMDTLDSGEPELQRVYNKYDQTSQHHIEVPKNLCNLYEYYKSILCKNKVFYKNREYKNEKIFSFCHLGLLFITGNLEEVEEFDKELLLTIQYANNPPIPNSGFGITRHPNPAHSGAEIYILHGKNVKNPKIAKIFRSQSPEGLKPAFSELSNHLISLSLNQDPSNIKMVRVFSAGYSHFPNSKEPWIFCMLLEKASGESIKELFHNKFAEFIDNPKCFIEILKDSAEYLAHFHTNFSYGNFIEKKSINLEVRNKEIEERNKFCRERIRMLSQNIVFDPCALGFKPKDALNNIGVIFDQGIFQSSKIQDSEGEKKESERPNIKGVNEHAIESGNKSRNPTNGAKPSNLGIESQLLTTKTLDENKSIKQPSIGEGPFLLDMHLVDNLLKLANCNIVQEDRVIIHGDMHIGNLCYKKEQEASPLKQFTMIDFSSIKRTYAEIGDPAQDVGKFLGSIWGEIVTLCFNRKHNSINSLEAWYSTLCKGQEAFLESYIDALKSTKLYKKHFTNSTSEFMATFRQRAYYYKLYLYAEFFAALRITEKAKELLYYFFLRESGMLDQVINTNSSNANTGSKIDRELSPVQVGSNLGSSKDPVYDTSNHFSPVRVILERVPDDRYGDREKRLIGNYDFITWLSNTNTNH